ncbi:NAD(P)H-binding protein [Streptomyces macrosporus]|uniref:NAD(P)H-binding protein n=1 Tax=Streptomyces macrosporus TaxID=44032 RepID=A0ABN3JGA4_9ACTN
MILVTGASGTVGGETARLLAEGGHRARLLLRDPARLPDPRPAAEVVVGDYDDPEALRAAMSGVRAALIVTADPSAPRHDAALVRAARQAGARRLVKLSALAVANPAADDLITRWQREAEETVRSSGLEYTLLRPRAFMSNTLGWAEEIRRTGTVRAWPVDAPSACVDPRDVAAVAVRALTEPGHAGCAYPLTGPRALTVRQQVAVLAHALGRPLAVEELSEGELRRRLARRWPEPLADALAEMAARRLDGGTARVDPTVEKLLGRPARDYSQWVSEHLSAFR